VNHDVTPFDILQQYCATPPRELKKAKEEHQWWRDILGDHYKAFFDSTNTPKANFRKIQHLQVWDAILSRYSNVNIVWAHIGLSKELRSLHPLVHSHIMRELFNRHPNLHADVSWDILAKLLLMNYDAEDTIEQYHPDNHNDFDQDAAAFIFNQTHVKEVRRKLHGDVWLHHKESVHATGSQKVLGGPTHAMALYLGILEEYSDRFVTGTDFVASFGDAESYPGLKEYKFPATGCVKDKANHARQVTDTSSINMFLSDNAFRNIVLGNNYFRLAGISDKFSPPPICGHEETSVLPVEALVGIGVGAAILIVFLLVLLLVCWCRRGNSSPDTAPPKYGRSSATTSV